MRLSTPLPTWDSKYLRNLLNYTYIYYETWLMWALNYAHIYTIPKSTNICDIWRIAQYPTIKTTIEKYKNSTTGASNPRSGRPQALSEIYKQYIHLLVKRDPFIATEEIWKLLDKHVSPDTIARELKRSGYSHWRVQKRASLKRGSR